MAEISSGTATCACAKAVSCEAGFRPHTAPPLIAVCGHRRLPGWYRYRRVPPQGNAMPPPGRPETVLRVWRKELPPFVRRYDSLIDGFVKPIQGQQ